MEGPKVSRKRDTGASGRVRGGGHLRWMRLSTVLLPHTAILTERMSVPLGRVQDVEGQKAGGVKPNVDHHGPCYLHHGCPAWLTAVFGQDGHCAAKPPHGL